MHTLNLDLYNRTSVSFVAVRCYTGHRATGLLFISNGVTRRERASNGEYTLKVYVMCRYRGVREPSGPLRRGEKLTQYPNLSLLTLSSSRIPFGRTAGQSQTLDPNNTERSGTTFTPHPATFS